jgi:hypothetical protein
MIRLTRSSTFFRAVRCTQAPCRYSPTARRSLSTLLLGGIPAAIYERMRGLKQSTPLSAGLWFLTTLLLTLPTLREAAGAE